MLGKCQILSVFQSSLTSNSVRIPELPGSGLIFPDADPAKSPDSQHKNTKKSYTEHTVALRDPGSGTFLASGSGMEKIQLRDPL